MSNRKPIFDAVRVVARPGLFNDPGNVLALDNLLDAFGVPVDQSAPQDKAFDEAVIAHLRREEGVRAKAYKDHLGYWTIGVGRLIDPRKGGRITPDEERVLLSNVPDRAGKPWKDWVLSDSEINLLLANDVARFIKAMEAWPAWAAVQGNTARMVALVSMCFQLGVAGLGGFRNSLALIERQRWAEAAENLRLSLWAKQTPARAKRVCEMIKTGVLT